MILLYTLYSDQRIPFIRSGPFFEVLNISGETVFQGNCLALPFLFLFYQPGSWHSSPVFMSLLSFFLLDLGTTFWRLGVTLLSFLEDSMTCTYVGKEAEKLYLRPFFQVLELGRLDATMASQHCRLLHE